jgi:hypothetical protein
LTSYLRKVKVIFPSSTIEGESALKTRFLTLIVTLFAAVSSVLFTTPAFASSTHLPNVLTMKPAFDAEKSYAPDSTHACRAYGNGHVNWTICITTASYAEFDSYTPAEGCKSPYYCIQMRAHVVLSSQTSPAGNYAPRSDVRAQYQCPGGSWTEVPNSYGHGNADTTGPYVNFYIPDTCGHSYQVRAGLAFLDPYGQQYLWYLCGPSGNASTTGHWC